MIIAMTDQKDGKSEPRRAWQGADESRRPSQWSLWAASATPALICDRQDDYRWEKESCPSGRPPKVFIGNFTACCICICGKQMYFQATLCLVGLCQKWRFICNHSRWWVVALEWAFSPKPLLAMFYSWKWVCFATVPALMALTELFMIANNLTFTLCRLLLYLENFRIPTGARRMIESLNSQHLKSQCLQT